MNCDGKMSFGDFIFPVNPYLIRVTHKRSVAEQKIPMSGSIVSDMGKMSRRISGEGEFCGESCADDFERLKRLYESSSAEMLYVPSQRPLYAVFEKLELIGEDIEGVIRYGFSFIESSDAPEIRSKIKIADGRKCLWDYSFESGTDIAELIEHNPDVKRPDTPVPSGRRIRLC